MMFSNIEFAYFLPPVFIAYWLLPRRAGAQNALLLLASYVFYASWNLKLLPLFWLSTAVDYFVGVVIEGSRERPRRKRVALAVSLVYNLGQLCVFKYLGFFAESLSALTHIQLPVLQLALPLGISFYTFQKLGYVIDVYYGRRAACTSWLDFATFVAFFPQLIAGPIVRGDELLPQLAAPRRFDAERFAAGAATFLLGFIKKAFIADYLALNLVDPVLRSPMRFSTGAHWLALVGYAVQVFCDFSGYSEMAIGSARLFGIELPVNFNYPFFSTGMLEFWRRWHITLNRWLFDYIYTPLTTGEGRLRGQLSIGFMIVFLASGLWHGAKWTFVVWGVVHGMGLVVQHRWDVFYRGLCRRDRRYVAIRKGTLYGAAAWGLTQLFFLLSLVPFRAPSLSEAARFAHGLFVHQGGLLLSDDMPPPLRSVNLLVCFAFVGAYHLLELEAGRPVRRRWLASPPLVRGIVYGLVLVYLQLFTPVAAGSFIYAQF
jgi:alginate O-acetyltransferase complex protein AlgI